MTHFDYLISRPGRPVHLAVFAYDVDKRRGIVLPGQAVARIGRFVPLCGQDRGARWQLTGTWAEKWPRHREAGVCQRCRRRAFGLVNSVFDVTWPHLADRGDFLAPFEAIEVAS